MKMIGKQLNNVREKKPAVHCITNYVTANDCANAVLALGGSPVMADSIEDVEFITPKCAALCINLGTLKNASLTAMLKAGKIANTLGKPVVLDPTGAGASLFRLESARLLLKEIEFAAIRGNVSEIKALCGIGCEATGVDAEKERGDSINDLLMLAKGLSEKTNAVVIITGEVDIIVEKNRFYTAFGGSSLMSRITGAGCMLTSLVATFMGANAERLDACFAAVSMMSVCGKCAEESLSEQEGTMTFKNKLIDKIFRISSDELERGAEYEAGNFELVCGN